MSDKLAMQGNLLKHSIRVGANSRCPGKDASCRRGSCWTASWKRMRVRKASGRLVVGLLEGSLRWSLTNLRRRSFMTVADDDNQIPDAWRKTAGQESFPERILTKVSSELPAGAFSSATRFGSFIALSITSATRLTPSDVFLPLAIRFRLNRTWLRHARRLVAAIFPWLADKL